MHTVRSFTHEGGLSVDIFVDRLYITLAPKEGHEGERGFAVIDGHEKEVVWSDRYLGWMEPAYLDYLLKHPKTESVRSANAFRTPIGSGEAYPV